jgi:hypothetical protein
MQDKIQSVYTKDSSRPHSKRWKWAINPASTRNYRVCESNVKPVDGPSYFVALIADNLLDNLDWGKSDWDNLG